MPLKKLKVCTIVGTRPEIIRLSSVIKKIDLYCDHFLLHTGQNYDYELNQVFFKDLGLREPDAYLNAAGDNPAATIANVITHTYNKLLEIKPDAILVLGDTNSCLSALSAKRLKIPVFHMEAGNRAFDQRVPEEINRKIIDHISDINLTYSERAAENLRREGLPSQQIFKLGSPMAEVLHDNIKKITNSEILSTLSLKQHNYFLLSVHREENVSTPKKLQLLCQVLDALVSTYGLDIVFSTHPRTKKAIEDNRLNINKKVKLLKPFCFSDYVHLQINAKATLSDSGTITEESSILNFPALNLREVHERPEGMDEGSVTLVGFNVERILQSLNYLESQTRGEQRVLNIVKDYECLNVSDKVVRILHSYTDYINNFVWKKELS